MTRKGAIWTGGFLTVTAAAVGMELVAALDHNADTIPWTYLISDYIPAPVTAWLISTLLVWLPGHFVNAYQSRKGTTMPDPTVRLPEAPLPVPTLPKEPLLTVAAITTVGAALAGLLVALGVPLTITQQAAILAFIAALAPLAVGIIARRQVYSPATVAKIYAAAASGQLTEERPPSPPSSLPA